MTGACNGCGSCCDPVNFNRRAHLRNNPDWRETLAEYPEGNLAFALQHWHDLGDGDAMCDYFDEATRQCLAYDSRPQVCSDYPWYGRNPSDFQPTIEQYPWCGYLPDAGIDPVPVPVQLRR